MGRVFPRRIDVRRRGLWNRTGHAPQFSTAGHTNAPSQSGSISRTLFAHVYALGAVWPSAIALCLALAAGKAVLGGSSSNSSSAALARRGSRRTRGSRSSDGRCGGRRFRGRHDSGGEKLSLSREDRGKCCRYKWVGSDVRRESNHVSGNPMQMKRCRERCKDNCVGGMGNRRAMAVGDGWSSIVEKKRKAQQQREQRTLACRACGVKKGGAARAAWLPPQAGLDVTWIEGHARHGRQWRGRSRTETLAGRQQGRFVRQGPSFERRALWSLNCGHPGTVGMSWC